MEPASHIAWKKLVAKYNAGGNLASELLEELKKNIPGAVVTITTGNI